MVKTRKKSSTPKRKKIRKATTKKSSRATKKKPGKVTRPKKAAKPKKVRSSSKAGSVKSGSKKSGIARKKAQTKSSSKSSKLAVKPSRIEELRAMLEARRAEILEEIKRARQDSLEIDRTSFPEVGDLVSASVEKEKAFEYGEAGVNALREIDLALEKLEEGTYGICESCGKPISLKRLRIMPSARLCIRCKAKEEEIKLSHDRLNRYPSAFGQEGAED